MYPLAPLRPSKSLWKRWKDGIWPARRGRHTSGMALLPLLVTKGDRGKTSPMIALSRRLTGRSPERHCIRPSVCVLPRVLPFSSCPRFSLLLPPPRPFDRTHSPTPWRLFVTFLGFFTIYLWTSNGSREHVVVALSTALAVLIPVDILRLRYPTFERVFEKCVGIFMRDSEKVRIRVHSTLTLILTWLALSPRKSPTA